MFGYKTADMVIAEQILLLGWMLDDNWLALDWSLGRLAGRSGEVEGLMVRVVSPKVKRVETLNSFFVSKWSVLG